LQDGLRAYLASWLAHRGLPAEEAERRALAIAPAFSGVLQGFVLQASLLGEHFDEQGYLDGLAPLLDGTLLDGSPRDR